MNLRAINKQHTPFFDFIDKKCMLWNQMRTGFAQVERNPIGTSFSMP